MTKSKAATDLSTSTLTPKGVRAALHVAVQADTPTFIWGSPGIGKSDIVRQVAREREIGLIDVRMLLLDPVDLRGLPHVNGDGRAHWAEPSFLPREGKGILFLDEMNSAPPLVQAAGYGLILDRRLGEYTLPPGWLPIGAGNYESDRAVAHRMPTPLKSRFTHLNMVVDNDEWHEWALSANIRPEVTGFLKFRRELLHVFNRDAQTFPCPRTFAALSRLLDAAPPPSVEAAVYAGTIGEGAAIEFVTWLQTWRSMPSIDDALAEPTAKSTKVPSASDLSTRYAVASAIGRRIDKDTFANAVTYLERFDAVEFVVMAVRDAVVANGGTAVQKWVTEIGAPFKRWTAKYTEFMRGGAAA